MKLRKLSVFACGLLGITMAAHANEVLFTANQPIKIVFQLAHLNHNGQPVLGEPQSTELNKNTTIPINIANYDLAGVVILSINGHKLPPYANQFNLPQQCSLTTDKTKATGALEFTLEAHEINCRSYGGVFG